jgi:PEGA domain-containing protein
MTNAQEVSVTSIMKKTTLVLAVLVLASSVSAQAQPRRGRVIVGPRVHVYAPFYYDPFWYGPYWGPYYPYGAYPFGGRPIADVRVQVIPKQTEVFVDGYYAGTADNFDGVFKRLHTTPGGHAITLYLEGYRTVTQNIYVRPDSTFKIQDTMDKLAAGEESAPPPLPSQPLGPAARPPAGTPNEG